MRLLATVGSAALLTGTAMAQAPAVQPSPSLPSASTAAQAVPTVPAAPADAAAADDAILSDGLADIAPEPRDRYEKVNRGLWGFNQAIDRILLKPISSGYRAIVPRIARRGISRVFNNLSEPWSFVNNMLQGKPKRALNNLGRFVINTTIGIGGLADHASGMGIAPRPEDFGQTLAVWGVKSSAYVVLPVFGPSTVRDGIGTGVAFVADPYQIALNQSDLSLWTKRGIGVLSVVSARAGLTESGADAFLQSSLDPYAAARSAFLQRRAAAIANRTDDDGIDAGMTDSTAADPMTAIAVPDATTDAAADVVPDAAAAPSTMPDVTPDPQPAAPTPPADTSPADTSPAAAPVAESITPTVAAWNPHGSTAVFD